MRRDLIGRSYMNERGSMSGRSYMNEKGSDLEELYEWEELYE